MAAPLHFTSRCTTGVDVVHGVKELAFLGVRGAQKVHMTQWRGRLILAVIESASVSLHVVEPDTHKVGAWAGQGRYQPLAHSVINSNALCTSYCS